MTLFDDRYRPANLAWYFLLNTIKNLFFSKKKLLINCLSSKINEDIFKKGLLRMRIVTIKFEGILHYVTLITHLGP